MPKITFLLIALSLVTACQRSPLLLQPPIPADLAQSCPPLPSPTSKEVWDNIQFTVNVINAYGDCAKRHDALVKAMQL